MLQQFYYNNEQKIIMLVVFPVTTALSSHVSHFVMAQRSQQKINKTEIALPKMGHFMQPRQ